MTITKIGNAQGTAARVAGWSGLLTFAIVVFGNYVLLNPLIVPSNVAATAQNVVAHQTQLRITAVCFLTYSLGVVVLLTALYVILKPVNHGLALVGALFRLVFALLWLLSPLNLLAMLRLVSNANYLQAFEPDRLQALARLHLGATFDDYYIGLPFFGLAATVCAYLWFKSNYIPKGLAISGLIASAWCVLCAFVFLIFPQFNKVVNDYLFDSPMALFELIVSFWLLFKGLKPVALSQAQAGAL
ncbi:MAG: DUF4386 domain-containing protein [Verrucomicrobia bacterium]|nr:MAG: DUF4386 domain-containing protein [Verrucomicrobiota bacterium]